MIKQEIKIPLIIRLPMVILKYLPSCNDLLI